MLGIAGYCWELACVFTIYDIVDQSRKVSTESPHPDGKAWSAGWSDLKN